MRRAIDSTSDPPSRAFFADKRICASALSSRNAGGTSPECARRLHPAGLAIQLLRVRLQAREIRLGVGRVLDPMLAVEEARNVEIRADVLDHGVRRVAPAADGDVAIRQREAFERGGIGASNDFDARARRMRELRHIDRVDAVEIGADDVGDVLSTAGRAIHELRAECRSSAGIETELCCDFWKEARQVLADIAQQSERVGVSGRR